MFWKGMRKINGTSNCNGVCIDCVSYSGGIVDIFNEKYKRIFGNSDCQNEPAFESDCGETSVDGGSIPLITFNDVDIAF